MFELHTTHDSISADNSIDAGAIIKEDQLSPISQTNINNDFQPSTPTPDQFSYEQDFSLLFKSSDKKLVETNSKLNRNPHNIENPKIFTPLIKPPSRAEVVSKLKDHGFPEVIYQEPFYSNPLDVGKFSEVGSTRLQLKSKSVLHLKEYEGTFEGISKWKDKQQRLHNYNQETSNKYVCIAPLKGPPSYLQAQQWLEAKLTTVNKKDVKSKTFTKLVLPSSPGELRDEDYDKDDDSITISQCTPLSRTSLEESDLHLSSPDITRKTSITISPLMASTPFIIKSSKLKTVFSKPSGTLRQSLPSIREEEPSNFNLPDVVHQGNDPTQDLKVSVTSLIKM